MKNSITHLPKHKQAELKKITEVICKNCSDVDKVILFGSYARGDFKELKDLKPDRKSGHVSDYDILAITGSKEAALDSLLWKKIFEECKRENLSASVRIVTHDIEALNIKLAEEQYFYTDVVKKEGIVLFDGGKFALAGSRVLTAQERKRIAQDHFDEWFGRAKIFFVQHENAMKVDGELKNIALNNAAFQLHQAAEAAYKTVLLVFSNYIPSEHYLQFLGERASQYTSLMQNIFAKVTEEDEARFRLLEYAYIGGRYDRNYRITQEDLEILAKDVSKLLKLTEEVCLERIKSFN